MFLLSLSCLNYENPFSVAYEHPAVLDNDTDSLGISSIFQHIPYDEEDWGFEEWGYKQNY